MSTDIKSNTGSLLRAVFSIPCCLYLHTQFAAGLLRKAATSTSSLPSCGPVEHQHPDHGRVSPTFTDWCGDTFVDLNVTKTKELIIDFIDRGTNRA